MITLEASPSLKISTVRDEMIDVLRMISHLSSKRLRERDFVVFHCAWTTQYGDECIGIGLPSVLDCRIHKLFYERLDRMGRIIDSGDTSPLDVGANLILRYSHGNLIVYVDPFSSTPVGLASGLDVEYRSAELVSRPHISISDGDMPTSPHRRGIVRHSLSTWEVIRLEVMHLIWETLGGGTFRWLRKEVKEGFGIDVIERASSVAGRHGYISAGWVYGDPHEFTCDVNVVVNKELPEPLKYVVLAHELSHYVLHFPAILAGQVAEQISWANPIVEQRFLHYINEEFDGLSALESHANRLATNLLVPPSLAFDSLSGAIWESGHSLEEGELKWRFLQYHFPETLGQIRGTSWRNLDEFRLRAAYEIDYIPTLNAIDSDTLYKIILKAVLERDTIEAAELSRKTDAAVFHLWKRLPEILAGTLTSPLSSSRTLPLGTAVGGPTSNRQVLSPMRSHGGSPPRLPLVPSKRSVAPQLWRKVLGSAGKSRTIQEWQELYPSHAITLYPARTSPKESVYTLKGQQ